MGKMTSFPILFDEVKRIPITKLKEWGYFNSEHSKSGVITWSSRGEKTGSINISVDREKSSVELSYNCNGKPIKYSVKLVSIPSNLGIGRVWYFLCPYTGKRCRNLYYFDKYFLHREANPNALYEKQTYSRYARQLDSFFGAEVKIDALNQELYSKHFKRFYAGKHTKRYLKIKRRLDLNSYKQSMLLKSLDLRGIY